MATDEREEEREFLEGLKGRTGRDLAQWMAAIAAQGYQDKNEIIDWLRSEGFPFSRASWLERIHRNGGKPIHVANVPPAAQAGSDLAGLTPTHNRPVAARPRLMVVPSTAPQPAPQPAFVPAPAKPAMEAMPAVVAASDQQGTAKGADPQRLTPVQSVVPPPDAPDPVPVSSPKPAKKAAKPPPRLEPGSDPAALEKLVASAKGYRPLYNFLEAQIRQAVPGVIFAARERHVSIGAPHELAAVTLHPTEIRLGLALGDRPFDALVQKAKLRGPGPWISHMVVLTDARQVNGELLDLVKAASRRANAAG